MDARVMHFLSKTTGYTHKQAPAGAKRLLVTHGWLRGNLGDACMNKILLDSLTPKYNVDVAAFPFRHYEEDLTATFRDYAAVLIAPGGGLQNEGDHRAKFIIRDIQHCVRNKIPCVLTSHSIIEQYADSFKDCLVFAREPATHRNVPLSLHVADLAWLQPVPARRSEGRHLIFFRWDNFKGLTRRGNEIFAADQKLCEVGDNSYLCSSDWHRDGLEGLSIDLGLPYIQCEKLSELLGAISTADKVTTDRYHPVIFSRKIGVPVIDFLSRPIPRDVGLLEHLQQPVDKLAEMATRGLNLLNDWLAL